VAFTGTKTITVKLKKGRYTYVCTPHKTVMKGSFTVK
jgi:plastocyanin